MRLLLSVLALFAFNVLYICISLLYLYIINYYLMFHSSFTRRRFYSCLSSLKCCFIFSCYITLFKSNIYVFLLCSSSSRSVRLSIYSAVDSISIPMPLLSCSISRLNPLHTDPLNISCSWIKSSSFWLSCFFSSSLICILFYSCYTNFCFSFSFLSASSSDFYNIFILSWEILGFNLSIRVVSSDIFC